MAFFASGSFSFSVFEVDLFTAPNSNLDCEDFFFSPEDDDEEAVKGADLSNLSLSLSSSSRSASCLLRTSSSSRSTSGVVSILAASVERAQEDPVAYAGEMGRACPLPQSLPVAFQILARSTGFADAVETNTRAAGDTCGRSIFIGAMAATAYGVPLDWALAVKGGHALWQELEAI